MKKLVIVAAIAITFAAFAEDACEEGFVSMFNGKDLAGWDGLEDSWYVEDGAIIGECKEGQECKTHYLYWTGGEPGDFILRLKIKLSNNNTGIQFRSETRPNFDTWGYQADFAEDDQWTGCLYQHDRGAVVERGFKAIIAEDGTREDTKFASPDELIKKVNKKDWNDYELECRGKHITLRLNGELMCEVEDNDTKFSRDKGIIALQVHQGPPMKVWFKDLRIKLLD